MSQSRQSQAQILSDIWIKSRTTREWALGEDHRRSCNAERKADQKREFCSIPALHVDCTCLLRVYMVAVLLTLLLCDTGSPDVLWAGHVTANNTWTSLFIAQPNLGLFRSHHRSSSQSNCPAYSANSSIAAVLRTTCRTQAKNKIKTTPLRYESDM